MYLTAGCPYCQAAAGLLESKGVTGVETVRVGVDPALRAKMQARSGKSTVPQIWIGTRYVGGCDELYALERSGALDSLLEAQRT